MNTSNNKDKTLSVVAYITIIGVLFAFYLNQDKKNQMVFFHVRQSLGLWLLYFIIGYMVSGFDNFMISYTFWIAFSVLFLYGIFGAISYKAYKIPLIGGLFQNIFKNIN